MSSVLKQANREALWALGLTLFYLLGWCISAYFPKGTGLLGFPLWFELSCLYFPLLFVLLTAWVVKVFFKNIDLDQSIEGEM